MFPIEFSSEGHNEPLSKNLDDQTGETWGHNSQVVNIYSQTILSKKKSACFGLNTRRRKTGRMETQEE